MNKFLNTFLAALIGCSALSTTLIAMMEGDDNNNDRRAPSRNNPPKEEKEKEQEQNPVAAPPMSVENVRLFADLSTETLEILLRDPSISVNVLHHKLAGHLAQGDEEALKALLELDPEKVKIIVKQSVECQALRESDRINIRVGIKGRVSLLSDCDVATQVKLVNALRPGTTEQIKTIAQHSSMVFDTWMDGELRVGIINVLLKAAPEKMEPIAHLISRLLWAEGRIAGYVRNAIIENLAKTTPEQIEAIGKYFPILFPETPNPDAHSRLKFSEFIINATPRQIEAMSQYAPHFFSSTMDGTERCYVIAELIKGTPEQISEIGKYYAENPFEETLDGDEREQIIHKKLLQMNQNQ